MTVEQKEQLLAVIENLPEPLLREVADFVEFLRAKAAQGDLDLSIASESVLGKDWLLPEEDAAWRNL